MRSQLSLAQDWTEQCPLANISEQCEGQFCLKGQAGVKLQLSLKTEPHIQGSAVGYIPNTNYYPFYCFLLAKCHLVMYFDRSFNSETIFMSFIQETHSFKKHYPNKPCQELHYTLHCTFLFLIKFATTLTNLRF